MKKTILITFLTISIFAPVIGLCDDAIVLKYSTTIDVSAKKCLKTETLIIQINNSKGDKYTSFNIDYSDNIKLKKLTGEIRDVSGNSIRKLTDKDIKATSSFNYSTFYSDNFVKQFSLKHNKYPYIVEVEFQREASPYIHIAHWYPVWDTEISTQSADLIVSFTAGFQFKTNAFNIEKPAITETGKVTTYKWQCNYSKLKTDDILAPSIADSLPSVSIVPGNFNYIKPGSFESWQKYGEWQLSVDEGLDDLTEKEKITINKLTDGISDPKKQIAILYHYMQDNTRYVLVNIDLGGLKPYPASYVCNNRFGDCKALSNYMMAMLSFKGIKSYKIDVNAGDISKKIHNNFPSQQFNHVILAVPFANDTIWLECTSNYLPVNYLGSFTQNRPVLWIEPNKSRILQTPALKEEDVRTIASYHFSTINTDKQWRLKVSYQLKGELFEKVASVTKNASEKDKRDFFNSFLGFKNYVAENYEVTQSDRDSSYISFETNGACNPPIQSVGEYTKVDLPPMNLPHFEKVKDRELPVKIYMPLAQIDTIYYDFESTTIELSTEKQLLIESIYGKLEMNLSAKDGQLTIVRKYIIPVQEIAIAQYKNFYDFINQLTTKGESVFIKTSNK